MSNTEDSMGERHASWRRRLPDLPLSARGEPHGTLDTEDAVEDFEIGFEEDEATGGTVAPGNLLELYRQHKDRIQDPALDEDEEDDEEAQPTVVMSARFGRFDAGITDESLWRDVAAGARPAGPAPVVEDDADVDELVELATAHIDDLEDEQRAFLHALREEHDAPEAVEGPTSHEREVLSAIEAVHAQPVDPDEVRRAHGHAPEAPTAPEDPAPTGVAMVDLRRQLAPVPTPPPVSQADFERHRRRLEREPMPRPLPRAPRTLAVATPPPQPSPTDELDDGEIPWGWVVLGALAGIAGGLVLTQYVGLW